MSERSIEHASFSIERTYEVPPGRVFAAWADQAAKVRWFVAAEGWDVERHEFDFRVGGREVGSSRLESGGPVHTYNATYWDIVPDERIVYTYEMLLDETRISVSLTTVELEPDGERSRLTLTEHGAFFDGLDIAAAREPGMGSLLDALARELKNDGA